MKKVDSSVKVDCHAVQAPLAMTEKKLCINKILGIVVGLWVLCAVFMVELDWWSAVAIKIAQSIASLTQYRI